MLAASLQRTNKLLRILRARSANTWVRICLGATSIPADLDIGRGVRIRCTDGGILRFARGCAIDRYATITVKNGELWVGENAYIGVGCVLCARHSIRIGNNALIGEYVTVRDQNHDFGPARITADSGFTTAAIEIGNNVWLGAKVTITAGVTIGANSVIGANAVVTHDIPANVIAAGNPARIVRTIATA